VAYAVLALSSVLLIHGDEATLYWLAIVMVALLISACWDAWFLLHAIPRSVKNETKRRSKGAR
jgi:hypothetical protein